MYLAKASKNVDSAIDTVKERIIEINESTSEHDELTDFSLRKEEGEKFHNTDLHSLFLTLLTLAENLESHKN